MSYEITYSSCKFKLLQQPPTSPYKLIKSLGLNPTFPILAQEKEGQCFQEFSSETSPHLRLTCPDLLGRSSHLVSS